MKNGLKDSSTCKNSNLKHFISAQKIEDGKVRLFAERKVSQANNSIENENITSLRIRKHDHVKASYNKLTTHKSTKSLAGGLRIMSANHEGMSRPDSVTSHSTKN